MSLTQFSDQYITDRFDSAHYELIHKIGEGGFGKVFKAKHKNTDQFVAIKFLALEPHLEEQKKQRYIERFKRETQLSSQLQHPHIVRLLDKGQIDDHLLFGVFEYVDGISLRQHLTQEGALNAIDATDVMLQVLDALIHAHSRGIIHRDIKPANIMLTKSGAKTYAKILDFGIGTLVSEHRQPDFNTLTLTQETLGTPSYSAPEQLRGEPATTKTDLYVWGLVYLECLTGLPAITGSSIASIYHKQLSDVNVPLPAPLLGHPLASLLRRILKKNAIERVITSQESFNELNSINVANLVGILTKGEAQHGFDDETVVLRKDAQENSSANHTLLTERKQITVLALKISITEVSTNTKDLDVIDALNKAQLNQCIDIATRFNAYHVGTLGDMLLFYFGFPVASDNDTRLSARTALEIMSEMSKRDALMQDVHGISFNIHIGLHTGVFVTYANAIPEGHITNTAMELARCAKPKQILCSGDSRAILEPYSEFEGTELPNLQQPGSPATVYSLKGERQVEAFGFMRGTRNNHELIGREKELDKTLSVIKGENTHSHLTHIHGEAGIGKSRLLQEIRSHAGQYQHLVAQCLPEHQNNALYPVLTLIRYLFSTTKLDASSAVSLFSDIITQQDSSIAIEQALPILLIWLNIELPENIPASTLAPDQQKALLFSSLTALLLSKHYSISENKLYIIEDIHWADTTTIEFIQHFAGQLNSGSVLISTSRQQVPTSLKDLTLMEVNLNKLTAQATEDFIIRLFDDQPVSRNVLDILTSRTDGIPLFIEELVGMLKQKTLVGLVEGEINFVSPDKLDQVPSSLRESLQQKLDSLIHAKETAQLAATIGREFEYELLISASSLSENQIQNDLNELIANDLIIQKRSVNNETYIFKHALVRDAAYDSMPFDSISEQHNLIANTMLHSKVWYSGEKLILIAQHFLKAKNVPKFIEISTKSINYNYRINNYVTAISVYNNCKAGLMKNPASLISSRVELLESIFPCIVSHEGMGSEQVYNIGLELSKLESELPEGKTLSDKSKFIIMWINYQDLHFRSLIQEADIQGRKLLKVLSKSNERQFYITVLAQFVQTQACIGEPEKGKEYATEVIRSYNDDKDKNLYRTFGWDPKCVAYNQLSLIQSSLGEFDNAKISIKLAYEHANKIESEIDHDITWAFEILYIYLKRDREEMKNRTNCLSDERDWTADNWFRLFVQLGKDWANTNTNISKEFCSNILEQKRGGPFFYWLPMYLESALKNNDEISTLQEIIETCFNNKIIGPSLILIKLAEKHNITLNKNTSYLKKYFDNPQLKTTLQLLKDESNV